MDDRVAMIAVRDILRTYLADPLAQYNSTTRPWIHTDVTLPSATFPRVQIDKKGETPIDNISIGFDYWEKRPLPLDIWFKTKHNFKYTASDGTILQNEELVKYYQEEIIKILKAQHKYLHDTYKFYVRLIAIGQPLLDDENQMYLGRVTINIVYYKQ